MAWEAEVDKTKVCPGGDWTGPWRLGYGEEGEVMKDFQAAGEGATWGAVRAGGEDRVLCLIPVCSGCKDRGPGAKT